MSKIGVLFSGGIDSTVVALMAHKAQALDCLILFGYGQASFTRQKELTRYWAEKLEVPYFITEFPYHKYTESVLFDPDFKPGTPFSRDDLSTDTRKLSEMEDFGWIEGRNALMMLHGSIIAKYRGCRTLYTGTQIADIEWPMNQEALQRGGNRSCDTTIQIINTMNSVIYQSFSSPFLIQAPIAQMNKTAVVAFGLSMGLELNNTYSCEYGSRCGICSQCKEVDAIVASLKKEEA